MAGNSRRKIYLVVAACTSLVLLSGAGFYMYKSSRKPAAPATQVNAAVTSENQKYVDAFRSINAMTAFFPLHEDGTPNDRYKVTHAAKSDTQLTFTLLDSTDLTKYYVSVQKKPYLMEQFKKEKVLYIDYGESFLANLEGKYGGMIVTDDTLLVVSSSVNSMERLEDLIINLKPVK